jgi:hypothetical protein
MAQATNRLHHIYRYRNGRVEGWQDHAKDGVVHGGRGLVCVDQMSVTALCHPLGTREMAFPYRTRPERLSLRIDL